MLAAACCFVLAGCAIDSDQAEVRESPVLGERATTSTDAAAEQSADQPTPHQKTSDPTTPDQITPDQTAGQQSTLGPTEPTAVPTPRPPAPSGRTAPSVAPDAERLAKQITEAEQGLRDPDATVEQLADYGHLQQVAYRKLGRADEWVSQVLAMLPNDVRVIADQHLAARLALRGLSSGYDAAESIPGWEIIEPEPPAALLGYYAEAEAQTGIEWEYLAAINLIETGMGRIRGLSSAGAQGPMQFIPTTWDEVGEGDVNNPRDAILAAGRYLVRRGGPEDMDAALWGYNNSDRYVETVSTYAELLRSDPTAFTGIYNWEIYFWSAAGDVWLPVGYRSEEPVPLDDYFTNAPWSVPDPNLGGPGWTPSASPCSGGLPNRLRTDIQPSGNRVLDQPIKDFGLQMTVDLPGQPEWIIPYPVNQQPGWYVTLTDGSAVTVTQQGIVEPSRSATPGVAPEVDQRIGCAATDPAALVDAHRLHEVFDNPLPDTRVVESGSLLVGLVDPTDRYGHGVLGDSIEAGAIAIVDTATSQTTKITIEAPSVIEGISPMVADIDGDGADDILVTVANGEVGARLAAYRTDGTLIAESDPIGQGRRWRNQLGVGPVGPDGSVEIVDVRTPHIGGTVQYFRLIGDRLDRVAASSPDYTSHSIGSRNLDLGLMVAIDDGPRGVLIPTKDRQTLVFLTRDDEGVTPTQHVELPAEIVTNLAGVDGASGAYVAVGTADDALHFLASTAE